MAYALSRLGPDRLARSAYRMSALFASEPDLDGYGGPVLGSDFPVEPANPFQGMYAAVTRLNPLTGESPSGPGGWYPEESLTVEQALIGFTRNAAYGWGRETETGSIEVGKWADWVVVDRDIFSDLEGKDLRNVVVRETWVGGKRVYPQPGDETWRQTLGKLAAAFYRPLSWFQSV
jgi:predicted amidohydrolase YtcJ